MFGLAENIKASEKVFLTGATWQPETFTTEEVPTLDLSLPVNIPALKKCEITAYGFSMVLAKQICGMLICCCTSSFCILATYHTAHSKTFSF